MTTSQDGIGALLHDFAAVNPGLAEIINALRELVLSLPTEVEEGIKYGGVVFFKEGELLGGIFLRTSFVTMEFSHGYQLTDHEGLLEGNGKYRRNLKFRDMSDLEAKSAAYFIRQAYA